MQELERQRHLFMVGYNEDLTVSRAQGIAQGKAEGIAEGEVRGELKSRVDDILDILNDKFEQIPQHIVDSLNQQTDAVALKSLVRRAAKCTSLDEFAADL
jgi:flagellar biosynthesis/type III secretory pathway protein FliH